MALSALAPDQRAVVQLVLQQERSYDDLAGLLGIPVDAVRARARAGLDRLGPAVSLSDDDRGDLADYLLGQQSVSKREHVRGLLSRDDSARAWARAVAAELEASWPSAALPEIPGPPPSATDATLAEEPVPFKLSPAEAAEAETAVSDDVEDFSDEVAEREEEPALGRPVAPRPRPRREAPARPSRRALPAESRRSSRLGGALLIGGLAIVLATVVVWLFTSGDDDPGTEPTGQPTPTATATAQAQPVAAVDLKSPSGGDASGQMVLFVSPEGKVTFQIGAEKVPASGEGEAYAVWLTGGDRPHRLGFAPTVGEDGVLATSGPRDSDARRFPEWFAAAKQVVISRETTGDARQPGPVVLRGAVPRQAS